MDVPADLSVYYGKNYGTLLRSAWKSVVRSAFALVAFHTGVLGKVVGAAYHGTHWGTYRAIKEASVGASARVLDVGSGSGRFLETLRQLGFVGELKGIDPFLGETQSHGTITIEPEPIQKTIGEFDLITLVHVWEHVPDPLEVLREVRRLLAREGRAIITVPVAGSYVWNRWESNWVQLDPPRHMTLVTDAGMRLAVEKTGLEIEAVIHDSTAFQFWGTARVEKGLPIIPFWRSTLASVHRIPLDAVRALWANWKRHGDQRTFVLRDPRYS